MMSNLFGLTEALFSLVEGLGEFALLVYGIAKANWELVALALILIEVTRIRGVLTGDDYEAFLKAQKQQKS